MKLKMYTYFFKICVIEILKTRMGMALRHYGGELNVVVHRFENFTPNIELIGGNEQHITG
jgi:hypothetical protein